MFTHLGEFIMAFKRGKCTSLVQRTDLAFPSSWVVPRPVGKDKHKNKQPPIIHSWCCSPPQKTIILSKRGKQMLGINEISSAASLPIYTTAKIRNSLCLSMNCGSWLWMTVLSVYRFQILALSSGTYRHIRCWGSIGFKQTEGHFDKETVVYHKRHIKTPLWCDFRFLLPPGNLFQFGTIRLCVLRQLELCGNWWNMC